MWLRGMSAQQNSRIHCDTYILEGTGDVHVWLRGTPAPASIVCFESRGVLVILVDVESHVFPAHQQPCKTGSFSKQPAAKPAMGFNCEFVEREVREYV